MYDYLVDNRGAKIQIFIYILHVGVA